MWIVVMMLSLLAVAVLLAVWLLPAVRRSRGEPRHDEDVLDRSDAHDFPAVGEPSPHKEDGRPVPGSRDDRRSHGKR